MTALTKTILTVEEACDRKNVDTLGLFVLARNTFGRHYSAAYSHKLYLEGGTIPMFVLQYLKYLSGEKT